MSDVFVGGVGAVSPAGWGMNAFREALMRGDGIPIKELPRPGRAALQVRQVPAASPRPTFLAHARLRRTSPIAHYSVSAALEALGGDAARVSSGELRLGIVFCVLTGCVNYSRRFYDEVLKDPSTASPLVFPETVYNSPASHLASLVGSKGINYTLVGDSGTFIQGLVMAADWLADGRVDGCLVIGAEEMDWMTVTGVHLFEPETIFSDGAGAVYLRSTQPTDAQFQGSQVRLKAVTDAQLYSNQRTRAQALKRARAELKSTGLPLSAAGRELLCDGLKGVARLDQDEQAAWSDWTGARCSVKTVFGEALVASTAWQCIAAVDALAQNAYDTATVNVAGTNQQAIAAQFIRSANPL